MDNGIRVFDRLLLRTAAVRAAETHRENERFHVAVMHALGYIKTVIHTSTADVSPEQKVVLIANRINELNEYRARLPPSATTEAQAKPNLGKGRSFKATFEECKVFGD